MALWQLATVKYQIATYSGEIHINCNENDEDEYIISKAKSLLKRRSGGCWPFGVEYFEVVSRKDM